METRRQYLESKFSNVSDNSNQYGQTMNVFGRVVNCNEWSKTGYEPTQNGFAYPKNFLVFDRIWAAYRHVDFCFTGYLK